MSTTATSQLEAIHAMLASGHRSIRMERHTLILWGLAAAFLILATEAVFTPARLPLEWQRSLAANLFIAAVLVAVGVWDYRLTRRARLLRNETLSFVQRQITKVWWLLLGLIVVLNLGMNFFGGGYMIFGVVLVLMGIALYVHGLFSVALLAWVGIALIALGLGSVALKFSYPAMKYLAASVFGLGFPALGLALPRPGLHAQPVRRAGLLLGWLLLALAPAALAYQFGRSLADPHRSALALAAYMQEAPAVGEAVVRLPAGTVVPVHVTVTGDVLAGAAEATIPLRLARDLDVTVADGVPDGRFRVAGEDWKASIYNFRVRDLQRTTSLTRETGPDIAVRLRLSTDN